MDSKNYTVLPIERISKIDFSLFDEDSSETARRNVDETEFILSWAGECPIEVEKVYSHEQIIEIIRGEDWTVEEEFI
jgi:hypothetical protein